MNRNPRILPWAGAAAFAWIAGAGAAAATEPCGDFGECKVLIEINASDGDIGFHFLMDGDDLKTSSIIDPKGRTVFVDKAKGPLKDQTLTETFAESAEPVCRKELAEDEDDVVLTLKKFIKRWKAGTYKFRGKDIEGEKARGSSPLTHDIPAAPADVDFDVDTGVISWSDTGDDLGECATNEELDTFVADGVLPTHPEDVVVREYEAVFEPDVEDGDPTGNLGFSVRVPPDQLSVTVPAELLAALPADTPAKVEVGAIGLEDNATFSEEDEFCINEDAGCGFEEE
ncbi:MAG: hypothetical protein ACQGVK_05895 [Myxococcota bacterium]